MVTLSQEEFETVVGRAIDQLPKKYLTRLKNLAITVEDEPTPEQRQKLHLHDGTLLFGLYEGVPMVARSGGQPIMPDKITLFKRPIELVSGSVEELQEQVYRTLWHEVAHYFGLDHDQIHRRGA